MTESCFAGYFITFSPEALWLLFFFNIIFIFHSLKEVFIENLFFFLGARKSMKIYQFRLLLKNYEKVPVCKKEKA